MGNGVWACGLCPTCALTWLSMVRADGIGKAFAFEFARKGLNVFLISRTESKLKDVQAEIQKAYPKVKVDILGETFISHICTSYESARIVSLVPSLPPVWCSHRLWQL